MVFENIKRNDVVSGLTLTAAGVLFAQVMPSSRWSQIGIGLVMGAGAVGAGLWGDRNAKVLAYRMPAAFLAGIVAAEALTQPAKLLAAWDKRDLWAGIAGVRGLSFAVGVAAPYSWTIWHGGGQIFAYSEYRLTVWLDPDSHTADYNRQEEELNPNHVDISSDQFLQGQGIPLDITVDFYQMSDAQIEGIILKTTEDRLKISHVEEVLKELERESIVEGIKERGGEAAAVLEKDSWEKLQEDYENRSEETAQELRQRISRLVNARAMASRIYKRFGEENDLLQTWELLPKQQLEMQQVLSELQAKEEKDPKDDAIDVLYSKMTSDEGEWMTALGIEYPQELASALDGLGLKTRADLNKHDLLLKEDGKARDRSEVWVELKAYREKCEAAGGGLAAAVVSFMASPSSLKEVVGPGARAALKVVGGVGYLAVWGACTMAHFQHKRGWFYLGASVAVIERVVWTREWRASELPGLGVRGLMNKAFFIALKAVLWLEETQARWLNGNNVQEELAGERPINRDLLGRAATFGERGPEAQARVLLGETGLSSLYSGVNWWSTLMLELSDSRMGQSFEESLENAAGEEQFAIGTILVGRSCIHALCDTAVGMAQRCGRLVSHWR